MKDKYNMEVGGRIRAARELLGMSREAFSELCDISDSFLSDVERGNKSITVKTLNKICRSSHISADYIVFGDEKENSDVSTIIEMLSNLEQPYQLYACRILSEFGQAVQTRAKDNREP